MVREAMYDDVLLATDGSEVATEAAAVGISLAQILNATVHAVSVVESDRGNGTNHERHEANAEAVASEARDAGCTAEAVVRNGRPASEIRRYAEEADVDLIVVGTHGRTGLKQVVLGSVALEVIRDARRPVLSVSATVARNGVGGNIDDVCLATDGWSGAAAATEHALELAEACDARVHALYAVDVAADDEIRDGFEEHGTQTTAAVADRADDRGLEATRCVESGSAHEVILEYAAAEDIDMLVMGTETKSTVERLIIGSVSQRVVPNASVPVLTVRTIES